MSCGPRTKTGWLTARLSITVNRFTMQLARNRARLLIRLFGPALATLLVRRRAGFYRAEQTDAERLASLASQSKFKQDVAIISPEKDDLFGKNRHLWSS